MKPGNYSLLLGATIGVLVTDTAVFGLVSPRQIQFVMAKNERLAGKYAESLCRLSAMIGPKVTPKNFNPKDPKDKGWAFNSIEIRKEKAYVLEDLARASGVSKLAKWGTAVQEWRTVTNTFAPRLPEFPKLISAQDAMAIASKRNLYFELYFETTRCLVEAYHDIGVAATRGNQDEYNAKFTKFAGDFNDFLTKNKDLSPAIKEKTAELIERIPLLKSEFQKLRK